MKFSIPPSALSSPNRVRWWILAVELSRQQGLNVFVRLGPVSIQWVRNSPVPNLLGVKFTRPTTYNYQFIVHPNGGNAARLVCSECGASYPLTPNPVPCAFCAVEKESGIKLWWRRNKHAKEGDLLYGMKWEWTRKF